MRLLRAVGVCVCAAVAADGHAAMNRPLPRTSTSNQKVWPTNASTMLHPGCAGGSCMYYSIGCLIGCECTGKGPVGVGYGADPHNSSSVGCESLMEPTLNDPKLRTWNIKGKSERGEWTKYNPWRAPGHCKPLDPCGMYWGRDNITDLRPPGTPSPGSEFPPLGGAPERWTAGETATVAFSMVVNHGGGYQWRLCPVDDPLTEECFQSHPLSFATHTHVLHWESGERADVTIPATEVSSGVNPAGSTWRRIPIPAEGCDYGSGCVEAGSAKTCPESALSCNLYDDDHPAQFPPPLPGVFGYTFDEGVRLSIFDTVQVPRKPGKYILGFRYDCEQSDQVWNSCADIEVVGDA